LWPSLHNGLIAALTAQLQPLLSPRYVAAIEQRVYDVQEVEVHEWTVQVLDRYRNMKVVTVIEVVSPSNKAAGPGRESYRDKQREVRSSEAHLVEIDLLRQGQHTVSVPEATVHKGPNYDYLICVNRWPRRSRYELYRCQLRDRLPCVRLPLVAPDLDVALDIQAALEQAYWDGRYMLRVRYDAPCVPALSADEQAWANACWAAYQAAHPDLFPPTNGAQG
jgi:hypothetical protein